MQLVDLCADVGSLDPSTPGMDVWIQSVEHDSRRVGAGALFVALPGRVSDGTRFVSDAVSNGAAAVALKVGSEKPTVDVPIVWLAEPRKALAQLSRRITGSPDLELKFIAVTGTNGKTSVTSMLHRALSKAHKMSGLMGTLGTQIGDEYLETDFTTPEAPDFYRLLQRMVEHKVDVVCAEVSSIGIAERRVYGLSATVAVFLNLSQDHLDYHDDMDAYFFAKSRLFLENLRNGGLALINIDCEYGRRLCELVQTARPDVVLKTLSLVDPKANVFGRLDAMASGIKGVIDVDGRSQDVDVALLGSFNRYNLCFVLGLTALIDAPMDLVADVLKTIKVPGRMEIIELQAPFDVLVDYAHTPDALSKALETLKPLTRGRLICVFGCGGDRDREKRSMMGAAANSADLVWVTSDNPRTEDPHKIIQEILSGVSKDMVVFSESDRERAILQALDAAQENDIVLIAGKGHEAYQEIEGEKIKFSDAEVVKKWAGDQTCVN